jgi:hypothetical protein
MSRQVQVGDLVIFRVGSQSFTSPITQISKYGIHIGNALLIPPDWQVKGPNEEHEVEFIHQGLSPIEEVNQEILLNLDYDSIISLCSTNKEYNKLCSQEYFWRRMVVRDFNEVIQFKPVKITYKEMYKNLYHLKDIKSAIEKGDLYLIAWYHLKIGPLNREEANLAVRNGHLEALEWLEQRGILPDERGANLAVWNGHLEVLIWVEHRGILPNRYGANWAEHRGILPNQWGVNWTAANEQLEVLKWLEQKGILPNQDGANFAARNGKLEVLIWLKYTSKLIKNIYFNIK